jgi:hypothetical protein
MFMSSNLIAAENLAQAIRQVARKAHSEEDLRVGVEHALGATLQALGLTATPEYEKTTLSGSADAVYGHVTIEYKRPGRLAEKDFPAKLAKQIARYLTDQARRAGGRARLAEMPHRCGGGDRSRPDHRAALLLPLLHHSSTATVVIAVQAVQVAHWPTVVRRVTAGCLVPILQFQRTESVSLTWLCFCAIIHKVWTVWFHSDTGLNALANCLPS